MGPHPETRIDRADRALAERSLVGVVVYTTLVLLLLGASGLLFARPLLSAALATATLGLGALRLYALLGYERLHARGSDYFRRVFGALVLASALGWGTFVHFVLQAEPDAALYAFMVTAGLASGAAVSLSPWFELLAAYLAVLVLSMISCAWLWRSDGATLTTLFIAFFVFTAAVGRRASLELHESLDRQLALERHTAELAAAKDLAQEATRAKGQFLANMSHELRTPLNGVLGALDLLDRDGLPDEQRNLIEVIHQSGNVLLRVVDDILDFERIGVGKLELCADRVDLDRLAVQALKTASVQAANKGIQVTLDLDVPEGTVVTADEVRTRQVLSNLLANAVRFTERGTVRLGIRARPGADDDHVAIEAWVEDTGIGMSAETVARLGQPFTQADASTTRRYGGSGLGLAIAMRLVELMGSKLHIESTPGVGTRISFRLETRRAEPAPRVPTPVVSAARPGDRVLIAEDNAVNAMIARKFLERMGYHVALAKNGVEAVALCESERFTAILMDCHMPDLDGFEATRAIRARRLHAGPIIALTASALADDRAQARAAGMDAFLAKPLRQLELAHALAEQQARLSAEAGGAELPS